MVTIDGAVYMNKIYLYMSFKVIGCLVKKILDLNWTYQVLIYNIYNSWSEINFFQTKLHSL